MRTLLDILAVAVAVVAIAALNSCSVDIITPIDERYEDTCVIYVSEEEARDIEAIRAKVHEEYYRCRPPRIVVVSFDS